MILSFEGKHPEIPDSCFVVPSADIIGDVIFGEHVSVWFNCVIRGDVEAIRIGDETNIQDGSVIHVHHEHKPTIIGKRVTVGHMVMVHGCTIHDEVLLGMHSTILDGAVVNSRSIIAAGSVVKENYVVPEGVLMAGVPARPIRELTEADLKLISDGWENYLDYIKRYGDIL